MLFYAKTCKNEECINTCYVFLKSVLILGCNDLDHGCAVLRAGVKEQNRLGEQRLSEWGAQLLHIHMKESCPVSTGIS